MATVHFMGYVEPRNLQLTMENVTPITERDNVSGYVTTFTVAILDCIISVECETDEFRPDYISALYTRSYEMAKTLVNLISLRMGWGLGVHLDTLILPDGSEQTLMHRMDFLKDVVTAYDLNEIDDVFHMIVSDVNLSMATDDLVGSISLPRIATVNSARALDALRHLLAPGVDVKAAWAVVQETLNAESDFLKLISEKSKSSRHGQHKPLSSEEANDVIGRTWEMMNRYLYYRIRGSGKLPLSEFPLLTSS